MLKVIVNRSGGPDVLETAAADPPLLERGKVIVDVEAAGVNYLDVYQRKGYVDLPTPFVPGFEGVGTVSAVGPDVSALKPGDRVAWINSFGSYATRITLPVEQAILIPASFTIDQAMLFQGVTAQYLLAEYRSIKPGDIALVHAAAGGVGQFLVQWLKHLGAIVIGTASSDEKLETVRSLGADHIINYAKQDFLPAVLELTNGRGVDLALDAVGRTTFASTVKALAPRGIAIAYGQASGIPMDVEVLPLILRGNRIAGGSIFIYIEDPKEMQLRTAEVVRGLREGWLRAPPVTCFALENARSAHAAIEGRGTQGKLVLIPPHQA
jgi:NADPH2:quinone reductase